jgi:hypothetical protein
VAIHRIAYVTVSIHIKATLPAEISIPLVRIALLPIVAVERMWRDFMLQAVEVTKALKVIWVRTRLYTYRYHIIIHDDM